MTKWAKIVLTVALTIRGYVKCYLIVDILNNESSMKIAKKCVTFENLKKFYATWLFFEKQFELYKK